MMRKVRVGHVLSFQSSLSCASDGHKYLLAGFAGGLCPDPVCANPPGQLSAQTGPGEAAGAGPQCAPPAPACARSGSSAHAAEPGWALGEPLVQWGIVLASLYHGQQGVLQHHMDQHPCHLQASPVCTRQIKPPELQTIQSTAWKSTAQLRSECVWLQSGKMSTSHLTWLAGA